MAMNPLRWFTQKVDEMVQRKLDHRTEEVEEANETARNTLKAEVDALLERLLIDKKQQLSYKYRNRIDGNIQ